MIGQQAPQRNARLSVIGGGRKRTSMDDAIAAAVARRSSNEKAADGKDDGGGDHSKEHGVENAQIVTLASTAAPTTTIQPPSPSSNRNSKHPKNEYDMNRYSLMFQNDETEQRYTQFSYIHSGFYGGKLWHLVSIIAFTYFTLLFHPLGISSGLKMFADYRYILVDITVLSTILTFICLFHERLYPFREHLLLVSFVSHWPALATLVTIGKHPEPMSYGACLACYFFCAFISQIRFSRLFFFLSITPLATLIILVTTQRSYFDRHTVTEIAFWPSVFFPIMLLRAFEIRQRRSFETVEKSERRVEELELKIEMAQQTVVNFFPPTPTVDLLVRSRGSSNGPVVEGGGSSSTHKIAWTPNNSSSHSSAPSSSHHHHSRGGVVVNRSMHYTNSAMIVTDLAGFTQWTASCAHDPTIVITLLTKMFLNIDNIMPLYKVEKIATVGDAFIGVIFNDCPSEPAKVGIRAAHAVQFGCAILNTASAAITGKEHTLKMRVGVHVGNFVGGFVGTIPPKFDLFGVDYEKAKVMESSGRPGFVHASHETIVAAMLWESRRCEFEEPSAENDSQKDKLVQEFCSRSASYETTETGVLCCTWESKQATFAAFDAEEDLDDVDAPLLEDHHHLGSLGNNTDPSSNPSPSNPLDVVSAPSNVRHHHHDDDDDFIGESLDDLYELNDIVKDSAITICEKLVMMTHSHPEDYLVPNGGGGGSLNQPHHHLGNKKITWGLDGDARGQPNSTDFVTVVPVDDSDERPAASDHPNNIPDGDPLQELYELENDDDGGAARSKNLNVDAHDEEEEARHNANSKTDMYDFSIIFLEFYNVKVERKFKASILQGSLLTTSFFILGLLELVLLFAQAMNSCLESVHNRLVLSACLALTTLWLGYVHTFGVKSYGGAALVIICAHLTFIVSTLHTSKCNARGAVQNIADTILCYYVVACVASQIAINITLKFRFAILFLTGIIGFCTVPVRLALIGDDGVLRYDMNLVLWPTAIVVFVGVSFYIDFSQRSAFSSTRKLHRLLVSAKGKHAQMAAQAMDIMLPSFVSEALTQQATTVNSPRVDDSDDEDDGDGSNSQFSKLTSSRGHLSSASSAYSNSSSNRVVDLELLRDGIVWEYPMVVVMFIKFTPMVHHVTTAAVAHLHASTTSNSSVGGGGGGGSSTASGPAPMSLDESVSIPINNVAAATNLAENYDEINSNIERLERVISKHGVQKVKTIGNTLLAVAGIDADANMSNPVQKMLTAALAVQEALAGRANFTVGVNSGPCFGAVIGVKGLCFDIFGDTVNTASRMCTTATNGSIQLSDTTRMTAVAMNQVPHNASLVAVPKPVMVKGKGAMDVYQLVVGGGGGGGGKKRSTDGEEAI